MSKVYDLPKLNEIYSGTWNKSLVDENFEILHGCFSTYHKYISRCVKCKKQFMVELPISYYNVWKAHKCHE